MLNNFIKEQVVSFFAFVTVNKAGLVIDSDWDIERVEPGVFVYNIHPFFYCLQSVVISPENKFSFKCVHLTLVDKEIIVNVEIIKKDEEILIVIQDLTEHYAAYQVMAQKRNETIINAEFIVLKNLELEEREKFKNQFIQNFSHELRNPLTNIVSLTSLLGNTVLNESQKEMLNFMQQSTINLQSMLEDILSISTISSGRLKIQNSLFNLHELLKLIQYTYAAKAQNKKLDFKLIVSDKIPQYIEGDRLRLYQVLTNLIDNALKYTKKGHVSLSVQLNQKRANKISLHFSVSDTGLGISEDNQKRIFESFYRIDTGVKKGTGLGLSIVKGLIELMDGKIKINI